MAIPLSFSAGLLDETGAAVMTDEGAEVAEIASEEVGIGVSEA